jgi:sugar phosphate isomerase/epimerase
LGRILLPGRPAFAHEGDRDDNREDKPRGEYDEHGAACLLFQVTFQEFSSSSLPGATALPDSPSSAQAAVRPAFAASRPDDPRSGTIRMTTRRAWILRLLAGGGLCALRPELAAGGSKSPARSWQIGHHFWNWDHAWNRGEFLDRRLQLTKDTGYVGFEAKPEEIGRPAAEVRKTCARLGLACAAIGGSLREGIDYASAVGAKIVRASVPRDECQRWVDLAGERGLILVIHPHVSRPGASDAVETREDLLRYLDARPGVFACLDTGHLALCGSDPVQTIRDLGERCRYVHLKDIRPERVGTKHETGEKFCELGTGALDLPAVIRALEDIRYEGWIMIERDSREPDYVASAKNMRATLRRFGY